MQLAREFFLTPRAHLERKAEADFSGPDARAALDQGADFRALREPDLSWPARQFFHLWIRRGGRRYFNKDVRSLTLPEAALLAGLIRGPNLYSPYKYPQRALERRNYVLHRMVETGFITAAQAERGLQGALGTRAANVEANQALFFVDMVREQLLTQFSEHELLSQGYRIYTTLDLDLQRAASEGARAGRGGC